MAKKASMNEEQTENTLNDVADIVLTVIDGDEVRTYTRTGFGGSRSVGEAGSNIIGSTNPLLSAVYHTAKGMGIRFNKATTLAYFSEADPITISDAFVAAAKAGDGVILSADGMSRAKDTWNDRVAYATAQHESAYTKTGNISQKHGNAATWLAGLVQVCIENGWMPAPSTTTAAPVGGVSLSDFGL